MVADVLLLLSANIFAVAFAVFFVVSALTSLKRIQRVALSAVLALATASHQLLLSYGYYHSDNIPIVFFYLTTYLTNAVFFLAPLALIIVCGFVLVGVVRLINKYTPANINIYAIPLLSRFIQRFEHMTYAKECEEERLRQERQLRINPYLALPVNKNDLLGTTGAFNSNAGNSNKAVKANANTVYSSAESKPRKTPMKTQNRIYSDLHMTNEAHENKIMMQRAERAAANAAAAAEAAAAAAESMADNTEAMTPEKRKAAVRAYAIRHAKAKIQTQEQVLNPEDAMLEDEPHALEQHAFYSAADFDRKAVMKKAADAAATADAAARAQIRARAEQATRDLDNPQRFLVPNTDIKFNHSETTGVGADESTSYTIATPNNSYNEFNLDWDDLIERSKDGKTVRKRKEVVYAAQQAQDAVDRNAAFAAAHPNKNDPNAKSTRFNAPDGTPFPRELPKRQDRDGTYITTEMANEYLDTKYHTFLTNRMPLPTLSELLHLKKRYQSDYDCDLEQFDGDGLDGNTTVAKAKAKAEASAAAIATAGAAGASAGASAVTDTAAGSDTTTTDHGSNHKHSGESLGSKLLHEISLPYRYIHELGHHHATLPHPAVEGLTHEEMHTLSHAANEPIFINDSESHTPDNELVKRRVNKDAPQKVHDDSKISTEPQVDATAATATADASVTVDASDEVMVEEQLPPGVSEAIDKSDPLYAYESTTGNKVNIYTASDLQEFDDEELANFRQRLRAKVKAITLNTVRGVGLVLCTAALICAGYSTAQVITQPDTKTITLSLDVPENFDGMRIMQLSDLHISPMTSRSSLAGLVMRIMQMRPDMIVLTGDISTGEPWVMKDTLKPLFMLNAPLGIYSIPGNDDYKMHFQHYLSMYKDNDFDILLNESRTIDCFGSKMTVIGIADESAAENGYFLQPYTQISVDDDSTFNLVITHKPNHARLYQKNDHQNSDLILTGSTTAGQINVFKNMVARANNGFINGLYQLSGSSLLYVSAGSGVNPALPIRYGSESEITLITIHSSRIDHNLSTPELDESHFLQRHYNTPKEVPQNFIQNQEPNFDNYDLSIQNFTAYAPQQPPRMQPRMSPAPTMQQHPLTNRH